jgi:hypothetical protein
MDMNLNLNLIDFSIPILFGNLDEKITNDIKSNLKPLDESTIIGLDDMKEWTIEIDNPQIISKYYPPIFNRRSEYAKHHSYFEMLSHASSGSDRHKLIESSNARYAKRYESSYRTTLYPCTIQIMALIEQIHKLNKQFKLDLTNSLKAKSIPHSDEIVSGMFRNVAVQFHFNKPSLPAEKTLHLDHINSCIHIAITLNGTRDILFVDKNLDRQKITLKPNNVYLTSPTYVLHGIEVPELAEDNASISIQLRTLLSPESATNLYKNHTKDVCAIICDVLKRYDGKIVLPTYDEYRAELELIIKEASVYPQGLPVRENSVTKNMNTDIPIPSKIKYSNRDIEKAECII